MTPDKPDLFDHKLRQQIERESPLAHRMRPRTLEEFIGQEHIVGPGRLLRRAIEADQLSSLIFYGPPGTGKTTLAMVIANSTRSHFVTLNAVLTGVKEVREAIAEAQERRALHSRRTTLFVDEVHRWNKAQQDALLPHVERGVIILIGATTENPYFEVNKALVSRSRIFQLRPLTEVDLYRVAEQALRDAERGYGRRRVELTPEALAHLVNVANGDARSLLNALELAVETTLPDAQGVIRVDVATAEESIQRRAVLYDKDGDAHYDTISAFIKSLRGSDPDAALYWLARMVYAGEDPRFIFRRMGIFAGEDVGLADPQAARVVESCWALFERIGLPEGQFPLAEAALYLATAPKSNSVLAYFDALETVQREREAETPTHLKDSNRDKEGFGHGAGYLYPHAFRDHWVAQRYLPAALQGRVFYQPGDQGYEAQLAALVARRREAQLAALVEQQEEPVEVWSYAPAAPGRAAWLRRAIESSGRDLEGVRDHLFARMAVQRHHLILDLKAAGGLLLWEALRRAPEGGVWGLVEDAAQAAMLRAQAGRLPELERPQLVSDLATLLEEGVSFDWIMGRNLFTHLHGNPLLEAARRLLGPAGRLCVAQIAPRYGQRLHLLLDWQGLETWRELAAAAEETLWAMPADPRLNWDLPDLTAALSQAGFHDITLERYPHQTLRHITSQEIERWFGPAGSYRRCLEAADLPAAVIAQLEGRARQQWRDQALPWQSVYLIVTAA